MKQQELTVLLCLIWALTLLYGEMFAYWVPPLFTCSWPHLLRTTTPSSSSSTVSNHKVFNFSLPSFLGHTSFFRLFTLHNQNQNNEAIAKKNILWVLWIMKFKTLWLVAGIFEYKFLVFTFNNNSIISIMECGGNMYWIYNFYFCWKYLWGFVEHWTVWWFLAAVAKRIDPKPAWLLFLQHVLNYVCITVSFYKHSKMHN